MKTCKRLCFIGSDIYIECSLAAHKMGEHLEGKGKIATVGVIDSSNAEASIKNRIFVTQLKNHYPEIELAGNEGCGKYEIKNRAKEITEKLLNQHPDMDGIYSNADEALTGISKAAVEKGFNDLCIVGYTNEPHLMELLDEGRITWGIVHNRFIYGYDSMVILYNRLVCQIVPPRKRILNNPEMVNTENYSEHWSQDEGFLISDQTKRYLAKSVDKRPQKPLEFELQLEGVGTWFNEIIKGAKEAEKTLPDTKITVNNWKVSGLSDKEIEQKRQAQLQRALDDGVDGVVLWILNYKIVPHINNVVEKGMEVVVFHTEPVNYDGITPEVDEVFTSLFRQMILHDHAEQRLRRLSNEDELTGLFNRRRFNRFMEQELKSLPRMKNSKLSLLMIDVDNFKQFNDRHGHLTGDMCLQEVASLIKKSARRARDFPARYGGEEFSLVLPGTDIEGAVLIAEDLKKNIENATSKRCEPFSDVTVSIGVASVEKESCRDGNWSALVTKADSALYRAKQEGRNRVAKEC